MISGDQSQVETRFPHLMYGEASASSYGLRGLNCERGRYELQSKDREREGKNHFFILLVVIVTPSPRQCHTTSLDINVAKPWSDWKDLQHMTRYESAIIVNTHTHTYSYWTEPNAMFSKIPHLRCNSYPRNHLVHHFGQTVLPRISIVYKQVYSI